MIVYQDGLGTTLQTERAMKQPTHTLTTKRNRPFFFLSCARVRRALLRLLDAVPHDCAGPSLSTLPKGPEAIPRHVAGGAGNACFEPLCAKNDQSTKTGSGQT
jgi:hypothetical protein